MSFKIRSLSISYQKLWSHEKFYTLKILNFYFYFFIIILLFDYTDVYVVLIKIKTKILHFHLLI